jgi:hypothetical protein
MGAISPLLNASSKTGKDEGSFKSKRDIVTDPKNSRSLFFQPFNS